MSLQLFHNPEFRLPSTTVLEANKVAYVQVLWFLIQGLQPGCSLAGLPWLCDVQTHTAVALPRKLDGSPLWGLTLHSIRACPGPLPG